MFSFPLMRPNEYVYSLTANAHPRRYHGALCRAGRDEMLWTLYLLYVHCSFRISIILTEENATEACKVVLKCDFFAWYHAHPIPVPSLGAGVVWTGRERWSFRSGMKQPSAKRTPIMQRGFVEVCQSPTFVNRVS